MLKGHDALRRFKELTGNNHTEFERRIIVNDPEGETIVVEDFGIVITIDPHDSDFSKIDIMWEDYGLSDFREKGLFGRFTAKYNDIELDLDELVITDSNGNTMHLPY